jgi:hypothetical protein
MKLGAVLLDPYALTRENGDSDNEHRFITLGMGAKDRICVWFGRYAKSLFV